MATVQIRDGDVGLGCTQRPDGYADSLDVVGQTIKNTQVDPNTSERLGGWAMSHVLAGKPDSRSAVEEKSGVRFGTY